MTRADDVARPADASTRGAPDRGQDVDDSPYAAEPSAEAPADSSAPRPVDGAEDAADETMRVARGLSTPGRKRRRNRRGRRRRGREGALEGMESDAGETDDGSGERAPAGDAVGSGVRRAGQTVGRTARAASESGTGREPTRKADADADQETDTDAGEDVDGDPEAPARRRGRRGRRGGARRSRGRGKRNGGGEGRRGIRRRGRQRGGWSAVRRHPEGGDRPAAGHDRRRPSYAEPRAQAAARDHISTSGTSRRSWTPSTG